MNNGFTTFTPFERMFRLFSGFLVATLISLSARAATVVLDYHYPVNAYLPDVGEHHDTRLITAGITNITKVEAHLKISPRGAGGYNGEIYAQLSHGGRTAILLNQPGADEEQWRQKVGYPDTGGYDLTFSDSSPNDVHWYRNVVTLTPGEPLTGTFQADGRNPLDNMESIGEGIAFPRSRRLDQFNGLTSADPWTLTVADHHNGETLHTFVSWGLRLTGEAPSSGETTFSPGTRVTAPDGTVTFGANVEITGDTTFDGPGGVELVGGLRLGSSSVFRTDTPVRIDGLMTELGGPRSFTKTGAGDLTISGTTSHTDETIVREGRLIVIGTMTSSPITVEDGGTLGGKGSVGQVRFSSGARFSPGSSVGHFTTGSQTWAGGMILDWELDNASGNAGASPGWDFVSVTGAVEIEASPEDKIFWNITTINGSGAAAAAGGFDNTQNYEWPLITATEGFHNFSPELFVLSTDAFANDLAGGRFTLATNNPTTISLVFTANRAPIVAVRTITRSPESSLKVRVDDLLATMSDPDADPLELTFPATSAGGIAVTVRNGFVFYDSTGGANDQINYLVRDVRVYRPGDTRRETAGIIQINVAQPVGRNTITHFEQLSPTVNSITFAGVPNYQYTVQYAETLDGPWVDLETVTVGATGSSTVTDTSATGDVRFYRVRR